MAQEPDLALIAELLEMIDREPPAIGARKLLVEQYLAIGWIDAAREAIQLLGRLAPNDGEVGDWAKSFPPMANDALLPSPATKNKRGRQRPVGSVTPVSLPGDAAQQGTVKEDFIKSLKLFKMRAANLFRDTKSLGNLESDTGANLQSSRHMDRLEALAEGRITTVTRLRTSATESGANSLPAPQPQSVKAVAWAMKAEPEKSLGLVVADFSEIVDWKRSLTVEDTEPDDDMIREILVKRSRALEAILNDESRRYPSIALTHIEHELLNRKYVNDETMLGDRIEDIPRDSFFVSEDGYAWEMNELVQAITVNGGVMRNPLSRKMFSPYDVALIVQHPIGKSLAALQIEQHELAKGVRSTTVDQMHKLAKILLEDQGADQVPSRHAMDEFFAYLATLPDSEQKALDKLRVPAKDSHTGQAYDASIGESLRDAKGQRTCTHKTG